MPDDSSSLGEESRESESRSIESYFTTNYELFTILGLFAALSVYLTQLPNEMSVEVQAGIGGSLILFVIIGFVVINKTSNCAASALNEGLFLRFSAYILIIFCLGGLEISVVSLMNRYSQGTVPLIDYSITFGFTASYIAFLQQDNGFMSYEGSTPLQNLIPYSPHIAAVLLGTWHFQTGLFDESLQAAQDEMMFGVVIGLALVHFLTSVFIGTCMVYIDRICERAYSTVFTRSLDVIGLNK